MTPPRPENTPALKELSSTQVNSILSSDSKIQEEKKRDFNISVLPAVF